MVFFQTFKTNSWPHTECNWPVYWLALFSICKFHWSWRSIRYLCSNRRVKIFNLLAEAKCHAVRKMILCRVSIDNHNRISLESLENLHHFNICEKNNYIIMMFLYWDNEFPVYRVMSFWLRSRLYKLCCHISNLIKCKYHFELYLKQIITLCAFQLRQADENFCSSIWKDWR